MDEIRNLLGEEIKGEIQKLSSLNAGSDEKSKAIDDVAKLYRLKIEEEKADTERIDLQDKRASEEIQRRDQKIDRLINVGVQAGVTIGGWIVYDIWHRRGLKFEQTGVVTSPWTRNLMSKMFPKK